MKSILVFFKMLAASVVLWFGGSNFIVQRLDLSTFDFNQKKALASFESGFTYPFSDSEYFTIEHGLDGDYGAFFKGLGEPYYYVARCKKDAVVTKVVDGKEIAVKHKKGEVAAAICCVLRTLPTHEGESFKAWYVCDLKVAKSYQGEHLPTLIAHKIAIKRFYQCPRGFGICMNPPSGEPQAARIARQHSSIPGMKTQILNLYTLTADQAEQQRSSIKAALIKYGYMKEGQELVYRSTSGAKDYQIFDKHGGSRFWQLYHAQSSDCFSKEEALDASATYMVAAVDATALDQDLRELFGPPGSTAQIVSYGMESFDFNFLTSNQI